MADRNARETCGGCAAARRAREARQAAAKSGSKTPAESVPKSDAELLIDSKPAGR